MSEHVKSRRRYDATRRQEQARRTRAATLATARELFLSTGYSSTTKAAVAQAAGVSSQQVYKTFGNKAGLVKALFDVAMAGDDEPVVMVERQSLRSVREERDPRRKLRLYADFVASTAPRHVPIQLLVRAAADTDAEAAGLWRRLSDERLRGMGMFAAHLRDDLREGVTVDDARDLLWAHNSPELWDLLVIQRGWSPARFASHLADALIDALLPRPDGHIPEHVRREGTMPSTGSGNEAHVRIKVQPGEWWWGGAVADGTRMPFGAEPHRRDLATNAGSFAKPNEGANQSAPLLVSSRGRYVWSDDPFTFAFDGEDGLELDGAEITETVVGATLAEAFRGAARDHFPASGAAPAELMFSAPQYNTWIEMPYAPTQEGVLAYARGVLEAGFPPGLLMIDDRWSEDYGDWRFDPTRFPDPASMTAQLHAWGFAVMLWLVPFVSPDSETSRTAAARGWLVREPDGRPAVREWWNGFSTVLDLTHPDAVGWLRGRLDDLRETYGVDGFKLDAGDVRDYRPTDLTYAGSGPGIATQQCEAWAGLA